MFDGHCMPLCLTRITDLNLVTVAPSGHLCNIKKRTIETRLLTVLFPIFILHVDMGQIFVRTGVKMPTAFISDRKGMFQ